MALGGPLGVLLLDQRRSSMFKKSLSILALTLGFSWSAQALIELRVHPGVQKATHNFSNAAGVSHSDKLQFEYLPAFGLDVLVDLPLVPFGFGVRHEQLGGSISPTGYEVTLQAQRQSLLINKRLLDFIGYLGVIGSLGINHSNEYVLKVGSSTLRDEKPSTNFSYSIGVEAGANLLGFQMGAEAGYMSYVMKGKSEEVDLSGLYAKLMVGIGF